MLARHAYAMNFTIKGMQPLQVVTHDAMDLGRPRRRQYFPGIQEIAEFPEYPGVTLCATTDHQAIGPGVVEYFPRPRRRGDITIGKNRYGYVFTDAADGFIFGFTQEAVRAGTTVHRQCRYTASLGNFRDFGSVSIAAVGTGAYFEGDGNIHGGDHGFQYLTDKWNIEINEIEVSEDDFWTLLPSIVAALDDPSADYSALYSYKVAEQAASQVKIMLSSIGADEIFAGRSRYRSTLRPAWFGGKAMYARGFMEGLGLLRQEKSSWRDGIHAAQNRNESVVITKLQQAQALDAGDFLANDLLNVSDRAFAAHSIEMRYPYLEPDIVRLGYRLDDQLKIAHGLGKSLLRHRLRQKYADPIVSRRSRRASIPARDWIAGRAQDLGNLIADSPGVAEIFHKVEVRHLFRTMQGPAAKRPGLAAWQLLFYALWHKIHLEGASPEGDVFKVLRS